jgi:hypothetical protein
VRKKKEKRGRGATYSFQSYSQPAVRNFTIIVRIKHYSIDCSLAKRIVTCLTADTVIIVDLEVRT